MKMIKSFVTLVALLTTLVGSAFACGSCGDACCPDDIICSCGCDD